MNKTLLAAAAAPLLLACPALAQDAGDVVTGTTAAPAVDALGAPGEREGRMVRVDGAEIFVEESGSGPDLVLLHGYPLSGALFSRVRPALEEHFTVVTLDHRGYGQSQARRAGGSVEAYAEDALAVIDELGIENAIVGGMSMGGPIVFSMYEQAPERFGGLVLIDTTASSANPAERGLWEGTEAIIKKDGMAPIYPALLPDMLSGQTRLNQPEVGEYLTEVMEGATTAAGRAGARALAERPDRTEMLAGIDVPALVIVGMEDALYAMSVSADMAETLPEGELAIIPGASHAAVFEAPGPSAAAILRWASRNYQNVQYGGTVQEDREAR